MLSSYQSGLPLNEIQDSYSDTSVQEHLMFAASKGLSHQEKKERKERDLCWPRCVLHVATYHIHWFSKPVWLIWNVRALLRLQAGNFWVDSCYQAGWFCKLCCMSLNRYLLLRKCQFMHDRKCIKGSCCERPLLAGKSLRYRDLSSLDSSYI